MPPLRGGLWMGVDSRNHPFALGLLPGGIACLGSGTTLDRMPTFEYMPWQRKVAGGTGQLEPPHAQI